MTAAAGRAAGTCPDRAWEAVLAAAWAGRPEVDVDGADLRRAARLAARHHVEDAFFRRHRDRLPAQAERWDALAAAYHRGLREAAAVLAGAGVEPVLIKGEAGDCRYGNFDLLVGRGEWERSVAAFRAAGWALERTPVEPNKLLARPPAAPEGPAPPAAHLHGAIAWFGVPVIPVDGVRSRCVRAAWSPVPVPDEADGLRVWLAHASFQNLALGLSELVAVRPLLRRQVIDAARAAAAAEGWARAFAVAAAAATGAAERLDRGEPAGFPLRLPAGASLLAGLHHAAGLAARGHPALAAREAALRPLLVAAKLRPGRAAAAA